MARKRSTPAPGTPAPGTPAPGTRHPAPEHQAPGTRHPAPEHQAPGTRHPAPEHQAPSPRHPAPEHQAPGTRHPAPEHQAPGTSAPEHQAPSTFQSGFFLLLLVFTTILVYAPVRSFDFVDLDDPAYVSENPVVARGLTADGVRWAFTTGHAANWHPLTWLSHMLDVTLFGPDPGAHHVVNVVLHLAATLLLFVWLARLTGSRAASAGVAALFALHPLHVESVAWIAERKDVLSTTLWMLTLLAWTAWVRRPSPVRYVTALLVFAAGLMAKPMLVTLPFVLLLLDAWPLARPTDTSVTRTAEKTPGVFPRTRRLIPFFLLAAASSVVTFLVQQQGGAVSGLDAMPLTLRVQNALVTAVAYLGRMVWPADLAVFYPYRPVIPLAWTLGAAALLTAVTAAVFTLWRRAPYLLVGWLWYLGTLVPVIGLVQVGTQASADRYTYVPLVGVFIMVAFGAADLARRLPRLHPALAGAAILVAAALAVAARTQVEVWRSSLTLWQHTASVTTGNYRAHNSLGAVLGNLGRTAEARVHFAEALRLRPDASEAFHIHHNLGRALADEGRHAAAVTHYEAALRIRPVFPEALNNLGLALAALGRPEDAVARYREAIRLDAGLVEAHRNLARALAALGRTDEAVAAMDEALRRRPDADGFNARGFMLAAAGQVDRAIADFTEAVRLAPGSDAAHLNLGMALAAAGRREDAIEHFTTTLRLNPANETARRALATIQGGGSGSR